MVNALDRLAVGADVGTSRNVGTQQPRTEDAPKASTIAARQAQLVQPAGAANVRQQHDMVSSDQLLAQLRRKVKSPLGLTPFIPSVGKAPQTEYRKCFSRGNPAALHKSALPTEPVPAPELMPIPAKAAASTMVPTSAMNQQASVQHHKPMVETGRVAGTAHSAPLRPSSPLIYHGSSSLNNLPYPSSPPRPGTAYINPPTHTMQPSVVATSKRVAQRPVTARPITHSLNFPQGGFSVHPAHISGQQRPPTAGVQADKQTARPGTPHLQPKPEHGIRGSPPAVTVCMMSRPGTASSVWSTRVAAAMPTGRQAAQPLLQHHSKGKQLAGPQHLGHHSAASQAGLSARQRMALLLATNTSSKQTREGKPRVEQDDVILADSSKPTNQEVDMAGDEEACSIDIVSWTPAPLSRCMSELGDPAGDDSSLQEDVGNQAQHTKQRERLPNGRLDSSAADLLLDMQATLARSNQLQQVSLPRKSQITQSDSKRYPGQKSKQSVMKATKYVQQAAPMVLCVEDVLQSTPEVLELEMDRMSLDQLQALRAALDARDKV